MDYFATTVTFRFADGFELNVFGADGGTRMRDGSRIPSDDRASISLAADLLLKRGEATLSELRSANSTVSREAVYY